MLQQMELKLKNAVGKPLTILDRLKTVVDSFDIDLDDVRGIRLGTLSMTNELFGTVSLRGIHKYGFNRVIFIADNESADAYQYILLDDSSKWWTIHKMMKMGFRKIDIGKMLELPQAHVDLAANYKKKS